MNPIGHFRFSEHYLNREYDLSVWSAFLTKSVQCDVLIFGLTRWVEVHNFEHDISCTIYLAITSLHPPCDRCSDRKI